MDLLITIITVVCLIGLLLCAILFIRNEMVYRYLRRVNKHVYDENIETIMKGEEPQLDWEVLSAVSYDQMLYSVWRSFDSFFPPEYRPRS